MVVVSDGLPGVEEVFDGVRISPREKLLLPLLIQFVAWKTVRSEGKGKVPLGCLSAEPVT